MATTESGYAKSISVSNTPAAAFEALTSGFNHWWTIDCDPISSEGDIVTFRFGSAWWKMRVLKLNPNQYVELECVDANHVHDGLPDSIRTEWLGSHLQWTIQPQGTHTTISLLHDKLVPSLDCYNVCVQGWDFFFATSLKNYLDTGTGMPFSSET